MNSRISDAVDRKINGCNCAQAVACTYCDVAGVSEDVMMAATAAFGAGMGSMDGTCGAITGAAVVLGFKLQDKITAKSAMKNVIDSFKARNGVTTCCQLKGIGTGKVVRSCNDCVADAAEFLENELNKLD